MVKFTVFRFVLFLLLKYIWYGVKSGLVFSVYFPLYIKDHGNLSKLSKSLYLINKNQMEISWVNPLPLRGFSKLTRSFIGKFLMKLKLACINFFKYSLVDALHTVECGLRFNFFILWFYLTYFYINYFLPDLLPTRA